LETSWKAITPRPYKEEGKTNKKKKDGNKILEPRYEIAQPWIPSVSYELPHDIIMHMSKWRKHDLLPCLTSFPSFLASYHNA
jgi:hypothetical protein